jgi:hypothetical protein
MCFRMPTLQPLLYESQSCVYHNRFFAMEYAVMTEFVFLLKQFFKNLLKNRH